MVEYFCRIQQYVGWCFIDIDGNKGRPIRNFDAPICSDGLMDPQMADGEIADPSSEIQEPNYM